MCTAISFKTRDHYFGRNLDLEYHNNECVIITPRKAPISLRCEEKQNHHYAMIGIGIVENGYPLYYEATNESGLSVAGLNFPGNAAYFPIDGTKTNIAPFELIPWLLGQCKTVSDTKQYLQNLNIVNIPFSEQYPLSPLHWMVSDKNQTIVLEQTKDGLAIYDNPAGVLTNNPPFPYHLFNLQNYLNVTAKEPENRFSDRLPLSPYSRGMGGIGLPGDLSSASRFVRATFTKENSICEQDENSSVGQFFHILDSVAQTQGCAQVNGRYEITYYSSCCNTNKGIYYYKTYDNSQITAVSMEKSDLESENLQIYPLITEQQIRYLN